MKMWLLVIVGLLMAIVIAQNTEVVTVRFLAWEASLSRVVLLLLTFLAGAIAGFLGAKMPRPPGK